MKTRLCLLLTARPEFHPPWTRAAHLTSLTLQRFAPAQVERLATHVAGDKALPPAVLQEMVRRADGVPLFVEELTKTVLESGLLQEREEHYELSGPLPLQAIPATLPAQIGCLGCSLVALIDPWQQDGHAAAIDSTPLRARGGVWQDRGEPHGVENMAFTSFRYYLP